MYSNKHSAGLLSTEITFSAACKKAAEQLCDDI